MGTYKEEMLAHLESFDGDLRAKMTDEQRANMNKIAGVNDISIGAVIAKTQKIAAAMALQAAYSNETVVQPENADIFADLQTIHMLNANGEYVDNTYKVAACKSSNILTGDIASEIKVNKAYVHYEMSGTTAKSIKESITSPEQTLFDVKEDRNDDDSKGHIIKKSNERDTVVSATIVPGDIKFPAEFNAYNQNSINIRTMLMIEYLKKHVGADEATLIAVVRNANRSYAEYVFEQLYNKFFGRINEGDIDAVMAKAELKSTFLANLTFIGSQSISSDMIRVGLNMRNMSIAPTAKWTSNFMHVKQNNAGFHYVSTSLTQGVISVPTDPEIVKAHAGQIYGLVDYGIKLLEKEVRAEVGLDHAKIELPAPVIVASSNIKYSTVLGLDDSQYATITEKFKTAVCRLAEDICTHRQEQASANTSQALSSILGKV